MRGKYIKLCLVLILSMILLLSGCSSNMGVESNKSVVEGSKSSADDWKTSTPEEQGMDSTYITKMLKEIKKGQSGIHSVLLVKNGYLVTEAYLEPFDKNTKHDLFSASKSITSALIGIALEEKHLSSIDQRVVDLFPDLRVDKLNEAKKSMTIKDLLTMSTGHKEDTTASIILNGDWTKAFLDLEVPEKPGTKFVYNSGASYMLSAILQKTMGENAFEYANKKLFEPMGIKDVWWETAPDGTNSGGWGLHMTPRDMAKFGYLYLNKGTWKGKQLVPKAWISESTQKQIETGVGGNGYGYQWWMNSFGGYRADGYAGQYIFVVPNSNLVAVFTGGMNSSEKTPPMELMKNYIIPSIKASGKIKANPKADKELTELIKEFSIPKPQKLSLPKTAKQISGKTYKMEANGYGIDSVTLSFNKEDECTLNFVQYGVGHELKVGLDGAFRVNNAKNLGTFIWYPSYDRVALKGKWKSQKDFILQWQYVGEPYNEKYNMSFDGDRLRIDITEAVRDVSGMAPQASTLNGKSI